MTDITNGHISQQKTGVLLSRLQFFRFLPEAGPRVIVSEFCGSAVVEPQPFKAIFSGHVGGLLPHVAAEAVVEAYLIFSRTRHARWIGFKETLGLQSIKHVLTLSLLDFLLSFFGILLFLFQNQVNDVWYALVPTRACLKAFSC